MGAQGVYQPKTAVSGPGSGNIFWANQVDTYVSGGAGEQSYEPRFTYHAFRYVELQATPPLPPSLEKQIGLHTVLGVNLRTAAREQAMLELANPLLSKLSSNSWWTEASGLIGMPHGAGARGERAGWSGDAAAASESEAFDFDSAAFFTQFLTQIAQTSCQADASIGNCIPNTDPRRDSASVQNDPETCTGLTADPTWSTVYVTIAHNVWQYYGATNVVRTHYRQLKQYMDMVESRKNTTGLGKIFCTFGDWNPILKTPCSITAALSYIHDVRRMVDLAGAIGNAADAAMWKAKDAALIGLGRIVALYYHSSALHQIH
jgi:alpha-L-rhamnosidase